MGFLLYKSEVPSNPEKNKPILDHFSRPLSNIFSCDSSSIPRFVTDGLTDSLTDGATLGQSYKLVKTTMQQCNYTTMQQYNNAAMQQCNNATMQQCNNATR
jgi:hypothetical protein